MKSLSHDKRVQNDLKLFSDKLPDFLEYLREQNEDYLLQLKIPNFAGSLLLDPTNKPPTQRSCQTMPNKKDDTTFGKNSLSNIDESIAPEKHPEKPFTKLQAEMVSLYD